jgi:radical SAM superfamily enzyme YgiQ (UPF0313 family)
MQQKRVCLINPPTRALSLRPPHGLMYISSYLTSHDVENLLLDPKGNIPEDAIVRKTINEAIKWGPDIVGISCLTTDVPCVLGMVGEIKTLLPDCKIVLGGIHPTLFPEEMLENENVDFVVMGEGEQTLLALVEACGEGDFSTVKGIAYKNEGKTVINEKRPMISDLDDIPVPAFDKVNMEYYLQPNIHLIRGIPMRGFYVFSTRGCPYSCRFCVNKNIFGRSIRFRDPIEVADEVEYLYNKYKIDSFYMYDDTFGVKKSHAFMFCDELKKRKLPLVWGCATRINLIDEEFVRKLKDAGCLQIDFGVESGSQRLLDLLQKEITLDQIRYAVKLCKKHNIRVFSNFMINLPTETETDIDNLIEFADEIKSDISIFNITCPFPGTDIQTYMKEKLTEEDYPKMSGMASYNTYIDFIESKCKLSSHNIPIRDILKRIQLAIPSPRDIRAKAGLKYIANMARYLNFLINPKYIMCLLRSSKKFEYLKFALRILGMRNVSTTKE